MNVSAKTHTTAVVLVPPLDVWSPIQAIRQQHDRNARRWMPHLTLLYPFAPRTAFAELTPVLAAACTEVQPFAVTLARFGVFTHGRHRATLYLAPEPSEPLVALQARLWRALPAYDDTRRHPNGFTPHLSVGQAPERAAAQALRASLEASWEPLTFTTTGIQLIWRGESSDDIFRVAHTFVLGSGTR